MQNKGRIIVGVLAVALTMSGLAHVDNSWANNGATAASPGDAGGGGASSGGGGASSGSSGGSDGSGGAGEAATVDARCVPVVPKPGAEAEPCLFLASTVLIPFPRPQTAGGLNRAQERTWDVFGKCATRGASIDQLHVDGSFTFQAANQPDARATKDCMTRSGYHFDY